MTARKPRCVPNFAAKGSVPASEADAAYAAGFLDGEGCIFIARASGRGTGCRGDRFHMRVIVGQDDVRPLQFLQARWGGALSARCVRANGKRSHNWIVHASGAAGLLNDVRPFLVLKAEQADVALAFQRSVFQPGPTGHSPEYRALLESYSQELRRLNNQRGEWL
jgi:hypothetical protein